MLMEHFYTHNSRVKKDSTSINFANRELFAFLSVDTFPKALRMVEASSRICISCGWPESFKKLTIRHVVSVFPEPLSPEMMID